MTRHRIALLLVLLLLLIAAIATRPLFRAVDAGILLVDLINANRDVASDSAAIHREPLHFSIEHRSHAADLYRVPNSDDPVRAVVVLVPGAARGGKDDPRLIALADTLRRARFDVVVPDLVDLRALRVSTRDVQAIADQVVWLGENRGEQAPIGVVAVSYAVGPAMLAALDPRIRERLDFVLGVGGYYDLEAVVTFFTTGHYRDPETGGWRQRTPNAYGKWVFVLSNLHRLDSERDRRTLATLARRKMKDLNAEIDDLVARLGPEGRTIHALLANAKPEKVPALIAALPAAIRREIAALSPRNAALSEFRAQLILVHGRDDPIIPFSESVALAAAVPMGQADLFIVDRIAHVDIDPAGLGDIWDLWGASYRLMQVRDLRAPALSGILRRLSLGETAGKQKGAP